MIPLRLVPGLSAGLVALLLLPPPEIASHASTYQNATDLARRQPKAREIQQEATALLKRAAASRANSDESKKLLTDAANRFESLAAEASAASTNPPANDALLPEDLREELRQAARTLRKHAQDGAALVPPLSTESFLELLGRVAARLEPVPLGDLAFQGSYSQTKVAEPVYGGHGSAMGPPPVDLRASGSTASNITSSVQFEEVPCIPTKTFCGGRTKDHILESGGSGVAVFDYDGDGWLDVYVVTAFELSDRREKIPHRPLPKRRWVETPERFSGVGPRCSGLGQRRVRRRLR